MTAPQRNQRHFSALPAAACIACALCLSGCASFQITIPDPNPMRQPGYTEGYQKKIMHAYLWGKLRDPQVLTAECYGQGINDVVVYRTLAHDLAGVLTLGLWMPTEVYFRCKAPLTKPGGMLPSPSKRPRSRNISREDQESADEPVKGQDHVGVIHGAWGFQAEEQSKP